MPAKDTRLHDEVKSLMQEVSGNLDLVKVAIDDQPDVDCPTFNHIEYKLKIINASLTRMLRFIGELESQ